MHPFEKHIYDRLIKAEWIDQITATQSKEQEGVEERAIHWRKGKTPQESGEFKLWVFSKLCRELQKGGTISAEDVIQLTQFGWAFGVQRGWEILPPS